MKKELILTTLHEAKQAAFSGAVRGLSYQDWRKCECSGGYGWNAGKPGFHCAVGWLIPWERQRNVDEEEEVPAALPLLADPLQPWNTNPGFVEFLWQMQRAHDSSSAYAPMKVLMHNLGETHLLKWPSDVEP